MSGLSEGIFWDYQNQQVARSLMNYFQLDANLLAPLVPTFGKQARLSSTAATELGLMAGTEICYRAGDQPNNAFSLNALDPGEVAATAGTSGVIYSIVDKPTSDRWSRVNTFAHVNHTPDRQRLGILLCVNGTGIMNSWLRKQMIGEGITYGQLNQMAATIEPGSEGLRVLPFGNGAERMFGNKDIGASIHGLELNRHTASHMSRAVQEGIVFSLGYGFDILKELGVAPHVIRAGRANMFLSDVFCEAFTCITGARLELFNTDGAQGAARGAGMGKQIYADRAQAFAGLNCIGQFEPEPNQLTKYQDAFAHWKTIVERQLEP